MSVSDFRSRLGIEHSHGSKTKAILGVLTVLIALYATWIFADLLPRSVTFLISLVLVGVLLYQEINSYLVARGALYILGVLVALTPFVMILSDLVNGLSATVFVVASLIFILLFLVAGAVIIGIGYYIGGKA